MPEYLSPGVYVEEIDVGIRPIEGVSTSTGGMIGVSERGPVNVPILVTSFSQYRRIFGGYLDFDDYGDACFLPHAVEGFFQNGGQRLFITRVVADTAANPATFADVMLYDRGESATFEDTRTLKHARSGDELILAERTAGLANDDSMRIGDGAEVDYRNLAAASALLAASDRVLALRVPLYRGYDAAAAVEIVATTPVAAPGDYAGALNIDHSAGATTLELDTSPSNVGPGSFLEIGAGDDREVVEVEAVPADPAGPRVTLAYPLGRDHLRLDAVTLVSIGAPTAATVLSNVAFGGDGLLVVADTTGFAASSLIRITDAVDATRLELHVLATLHPMALGFPAYADHPAGEPVSAVTLNATAAPADLDTVLDAAAEVGERTLLLASTDNLQQGDRVRIGPVGPTAEYHELADDPDGLTITVIQGLALERPIGEQVQKVDRVVAASTFLTQDVGDGETTIFLADNGAGFPASTIVEIGEPGSAVVEYQTLDDPDLGVLVLADALERDHSRGALVGRRDPRLSVRALDPGEWGNELRVTVEDDSQASSAVAANTLPGQPISLTSVTGIEIGTILDFDGRLAKVSDVTGTTVTVVPEGAPFAVTAGDRVTTREFKLTVDWVKSGRVLTELREVFRYLSLDHRHSRYVQTIVGDINGVLRPQDRRPEGQSDLIRVADQATAAQSETLIRVGPDLLTEPSTGGRERAAGRFLDGGSNPLAGITVDTYIGQDNVDPDLRTGLQSMRNENRVSIVAIPGRTEQDIQEALITHCEQMRYRFAILDSLPGTDRVRGASLTEVQDQRNLFDTRYAALYYPWVTIRDPFPADPQNVGDYQIPPGGHMMGIYARTDIERGVHKAPANTVVRGIRDLQRKLHKAEQDLLNPSPTNINVLRNFKDNGRGLRVWGARCITSETTWKYINVRRLFIFLEQSLDEGTQWVVFEPNDAPLWARVRQSITAFLTRVWRDGALQGATPEEAFFVKCDRTTMTQDDIDNGRLIVMVGVAPVKPAEFVIIRIFQSTQEATGQ